MPPNRPACPACGAPLSADPADQGKSPHGVGRGERILVPVATECEAAADGPAAARSRLAGHASLALGLLGTGCIVFLCANPFRAGMDPYLFGGFACVVLGVILGLGAVAGPEGGGISGKAGLAVCGLWLAAAVLVFFLVVVSHVSRSLGAPGRGGNPPTDAPPSDWDWGRRACSPPGAAGWETWPGGADRAGPAGCAARCASNFYRNGQ